MTEHINHDDEMEKISDALQSGHLATYNPETHTAVEIGVVRRVLKLLGKLRNFAYPVRNTAKIEAEIKATFDALNRYASPLGSTEGGKE